MAFATRKNPYTPRTGLVAGRTFTSDREYKDALARARGFESERARRAVPKIVRTPEQEARLSTSDRAARRRAPKAAADFRRGEVHSLTEAARRNRTTPEAIRRYAAPALRRSESGRYRPSRSDSLVRRMQAITPEGVRPITLSGRNASRDASLVARHRHAVSLALGGDDQELLRLSREHGDRLDALGLETDIVALIDLAGAGELDDLDDPYAVEEGGA